MFKFYEVISLICSLSTVLSLLRGLLNNDNCSQWHNECLIFILFHDYAYAVH